MSHNALTFVYSNYETVVSEHLISSNCSCLSVTYTICPVARKIQDILAWKCLVQRIAANLALLETRRHYCIVLTNKF